MKQTIRNNTFETNSSSMHSLVVVKDPKPYNFRDILSYDADKFDLFWYEDGCYERTPYKVLRNQKDKLRYYVAHYIGFLDKKELIPKVVDFIHKQTGISKKKINIKAFDNYDDKYEGYGYAGINDTGEDAFSYIERNNISMEEFVLNPKYVVIVDGDEYQEFKKLFESNILDANSFEYISSGSEFWNDSVYEISCCWLEQDACDYNLLEHTIDINKFIKEIRINIYEENLNNYEQYFNQIKMFFEEVKKNFPNVITSITCDKNIVKKVRSKDLSIFNYLKVHKQDFDDDFIEIIKLIN